MASKSMIKNILYWSIPITYYFFCMYVLAFHERSLPLFPILMALMLHPLITIPMSIGARYVHKIGLNLFRLIPKIPSKWSDHSRNWLPYRVEPKRLKLQAFRNFRGRISKSVNYFNSNYLIEIISSPPKYIQSLKVQ